MAKRGRPHKIELTWEEATDSAKRHASAGGILTYDELIHIIDVDDKGTHPTEAKHLSKMGICKIEQRAVSKLKAALAKRGIKNYRMLFDR